MVNIVRLLLEQGADHRMKDYRNKRTALQVVWIHERMEQSVTRSLLGITSLWLMLNSDHEGRFCRHTTFNQQWIYFDSTSWRWINVDSMVTNVVCPMRVFFSFTTHTLTDTFSCIPFNLQLMILNLWINDGCSHLTYSSIVFQSYQDDRREMISSSSMNGRRALPSMYMYRDRAIGRLRKSGGKKTDLISLLLNKFS